MKELKEWLAAALVVICLIAMFSLWLDHVEEKQRQHEIYVAQQVALAKITKQKQEIMDRQKYFDKLLFNR